jgi:hypothetical protein
MVVDLVSWLSNGNFITTSNATAAGKLDSPPTIDALHLPAGAWSEVLPTHEQRLTEYFENNPGIEPAKVRNAEEVLQAQDEMQRLKSEFRRQAGISKAELQRLAGDKKIDLDALHAALVARQTQANPAPSRNEIVLK